MRNKGEVVSLKTFFTCIPCCHYLSTKDKSQIHTLWVIMAYDNLSIGRIYDIQAHSCFTTMPLNVEKPLLQHIIRPFTHYLKSTMFYWKGFHLQLGNCEVNGHYIIRFKVRLHDGHKKSENMHELLTDSPSLSWYGK